MRLTTRQTGIISYAGLEEGALWAAAKRMFAQSDESVPDRFRSFLPIFPIELVQNMSYVGRRERNLAKVSPAGFSTDPDEYHRLLCAEIPELYTGENALRNFDSEGRYRGGGAVTVDRAWATLFPQYQPFFGERLVIHLIGGGHQAVAVPESVVSTRRRDSGGRGAGAAHYGPLRALYDLPENPPGNGRKIRPCAL